ncbi:hypothetical protein [Halorientalis salina]|jgi:hypothetical protein|uniref:hypothetical protein n=1 Tax=Halorientalis salina TaxID=2932266 RepID=UPI0010ACA57C|nr:hypothetical protein [Halorientalis salina]
MATRTQEEDAAVEVAQRSSTDPYIVAAVASVLLSWYEFFVQGNREMGLFVGLWPPTFLAFGSYFEQSRLSNAMDRALGKGGIMNSVERMIQNR